MIAIADHRYVPTNAGAWSEPASRRLNINTWAIYDIYLRFMIQAAHHRAQQRLYFTASLTTVGLCGFIAQGSS